YRGNFVIDKPLTLEGVDWPVLDGQNQGNVLEVNQAPDVTIRGLVIRNSGARLDKENAGIAVDKSPHLRVEQNRLENVLFGVYIKDSPDSRIAYNTVGAKDLPVPARGDAIRVWYSEKAQVIGNRVDRGRDVVLWYNNGAVIRDNVITNGRYGLHFMYCDDNLVENNWIEGNSVGAFLMYSRRLTLRHNVFARNRGPSGYGIGLKDMDGVEATDNLFSSNRVGIYFDNSPWSVDVRQHFTRNAFVNNDIGLLFNPSVKRNYFSRNSFIDNLEQVGLTGSGTFEGNGFTVNGQGNFWSDYTGYDADGDGLGDLPYVSKSLFENMMDRTPALRLFQLSPAQQAVELAAKAFPIFQPRPKFTDDAPLMSPVVPAVPQPEARPVWPLLAATSALLGLVAAVVFGVRRRGSGKKQTGQTQPAFAPIPIQEQAEMIKIAHLTKRFGKFTAVDDVSFSVAAGEAVALWGPNGAGKTTIIRCLLGLYTAAGQVQVNGWDAFRQGKQARAVIGYVPQELAFYPDLTARETLHFYASLKHAPADRVETVLADVNLLDHADKPVAALSGGMKQRLALAIALLSDPPLLVLDEPTSNLDTSARDDFLRLLQAQRARGKTLLFTSHRLEEVELLATRVLALEGGRIRAVCENPAELAACLGVEVRLKLIVPETRLDEAIEVLQAQGFAARRNGIGVRVLVSPSAKTAPLQALLRHNIEVRNFELDL
ncbi:MAG: heme ABC exporter ATP-binding protein CcmA, partial [Chloroflexi bacterium]